ncbi:HNH endonuclease [Sorangium sp. So ce1000]|uniref:HNH endonuclease n=1 Tax=Sorangium sp. So ce1000 TaxID=3133325 RepID=UPI003F5EB206
MKTLPPVTRPPTTPFSRNHDPAPTEAQRGYQAFRPCLRWEFGFTCALCMLHEADLAEYGIGPTGLTTVEHIVPQSEDATQSNTYANCLYACRWCNRSRSTLPQHDGSGNVLLNPTTSAWADHFEAQDDQLAPKTGSGKYTEIAYSINHPLKVKMRATRRKTIERCRTLVLEAPTEIEELSRLLEFLVASNQMERADTVRRVARHLSDQVALARQALQRYQGIPVDADKACRCRPAPTMPPQVAEQLIEI